MASPALPASMTGRDQHLQAEEPARTTEVWAQPLQPHVQVQAQRKTSQSSSLAPAGGSSLSQLMTADSLNGRSPRSSQGSGGSQSPASNSSSSFAARNRQGSSNSSGGGGATPTPGVPVRIISSGPTTTNTNGAGALSPINGSSRSMAPLPTAYRPARPSTLGMAPRPPKPAAAAAASPAAAATTVTAKAGLTVQSPKSTPAPSNGQVATRASPPVTRAPPNPSSSSSTATTAAGAAPKASSSSSILPIYIAHAPRPQSLILASRAPVIRKACDLCHAARRKCSGDRPKCTSCKQKGTECHYPVRLHRKNSKMRQEQERLVRVLHGGHEVGEDGSMKEEQMSLGGSPLSAEMIADSPAPSWSPTGGSPAKKRARTATGKKRARKVKREDTLPPLPPPPTAETVEQDSAWAAVKAHDAAIWATEDYVSHVARQQAKSLLTRALQLAMIDQDGHFDGLDLRTHAQVLTPMPLKPPKRQPAAPAMSLSSSSATPLTVANDPVSQNDDVDVPYLELFAPPPPTTATRSPSREPGPGAAFTSFPSQPRIELDHLADFDPVAIFGGVLGDGGGIGDDNGEISAEAAEALQNALISAQLTSFQLELEQQAQQEAEQQAMLGHAAATDLAPDAAFAAYTHHDHHDEHHHNHAADLHAMDDEHAAELHAIMDGLAAASNASASGSLVAADDVEMELEDDDNDFVLEAATPPDVCPQLVLVMTALESFRKLSGSPALGDLFPPMTTALQSIQHFSACDFCSTSAAWTLPQLALTSRACTLLAGKHPLTPSPLELTIAGGNTSGTGLPPEIEVHVVDIVWATWRGATVQKALTRMQILAMAEIARIKGDADANEEEPPSPSVLRGETMLKGLARLQKFMANSL